MQDHRRLLVWQKAHGLAVDVRRATRGFSRSGSTGLRSQTIRAAESVVPNIVEGCGGRSPREFARFLDIAAKSTAELEAQLELARDYGILGPLLTTELSARAVEIRKMLCGLRAKVLSRA